MAVDWNALELEFVNGSMTYEELAQKHNIKPGTVRQQGKRKGWTEKRTDLSQAVTKAAQANLIEVRTDELSKFNENDLKVAKAIRSQVARSIEKAQGANAPIDPLKLRALAGALESAQRVGRLALGATTNNTGVSAPGGGPVQITRIEIVPGGDSKD